MLFRICRAVPLGSKIGKQARDLLDCHTAGGAQLRHPAPRCKAMGRNFSLGLLDLKAPAAQSGLLLPVPPAEAGQEVGTLLLAGISFLIHRKPLNPQLSARRPKAAAQGTARIRPH
jgi:hypothetical protein